MSCFPIGQMTGLSQLQLQVYREAYSVYLKVNNFNSNVSTIRATTNNNLLPYYVFETSQELTLYREGLMLSTQNDPTNNIPIQQ